MSIPHAHDESLISRCLAITADFYCCGETVAGPIFQAMYEAAKVPMVRKTLRRITQDEIKHGSFGWDLLEELLERSSADEIAQLKERVPHYVNRIVAAYDSNFAATNHDKDWGVLSGEEHSKIATACANEVLLPQFGELLGKFNVGHQ